MQQMLVSAEVPEPRHAAPVVEVARITLPLDLESLGALFQVLVQAYAGHDLTYMGHTDSRGVRYLAVRRSVGRQPEELTR